MVTLLDDPSVELAELITDPFLFKELCWPNITFYDDQVSIVNSVVHNVETYAPAGNMLGKDFISGFIAVWFFCSRVPARVVTSSVDHSQLKGVLWGEIRRFIDTSAYPLGIQVNDLLIRQIRPDGSLEPRSELIGRVAQKGEGMLGRHIERGPNHEPRTLAIIDEASGFDDVHYTSMITWAHRLLVIGNPYPCENFFKKGVKAGDLVDPHGDGAFYRKVIKIKADRSPNVRLAEAEIASGRTPTLREVVPGVMSYREYLQRRATWDVMKQTIGLDAEFYEGEEVRLFSEVALSKSNQFNKTLPLLGRRGVSMGVDTGEGGDSSVWTVVDEQGVIEQLSIKTPDTSVIPGITIGLLNQYSIPAERVLFDAGGGGKEHVDALRAKGYNVKSIPFGGSPTSADEYKLHKRMPEESREVREQREVYRNRRAEMYGEASKVIRGVHESGIGSKGFGIADSLEALLFQLGKMPKLYDGEGVLYLPPKNKKGKSTEQKSLTELIGHSPDEADSFVLAVFGLVWLETEAVVASMF